MLLEKGKPTFSDFWISKTGYVSAKQSNILEKNDYVLDEFGIAGQVRFVNEDYGNYIVFVDGYGTYDNNLTLRKLTIAGKQIYDTQKREFSILIRLARILYNTISDFYPYTHIFNNGKNIWVRGSTLNGIVDRFTHASFSSAAHSLFSAKLTPRYTCEIENLDLKKNLQKSFFNRELIKSMFIDVDLNMIGDTRLKWIVSENEGYNKKYWKHYINQYKKYKIDYLGDLYE